jgi:CspA family cold shock protein
VSTGSVLFFNDDKGWGFIRQDDGGADVFVHAHSLSGVSVLQELQRVEFDVIFDERRGKDKAANVRVIA